MRFAPSEGMRDMRIQLEDFAVYFDVHRQRESNDPAGDPI
jgi:hypothetical protein